MGMSSGASRVSGIGTPGSTFEVDVQDSDTGTDATDSASVRSSEKQPSPCGLGEMVAQSPGLLALATQDERNVSQVHQVVVDGAELPVHSGAARGKEAVEVEREKQQREKSDFAKISGSLVGLVRSSVAVPYMAVLWCRDELGFKPTTPEEKHEREQESKQAGQPCWMMHPDIKFLRMWDMIQIVLVGYIFCELPFRVAFVNTEKVWIEQNPTAGVVIDVEDGSQAGERDLSEFDTGWGVFTTEDAIDVMLLLNVILQPFRSRYSFDMYGTRRLVVSPR